MTSTIQTPIKISDSEWEVMRVIWTMKTATAQEIIQVLGEKMEWKPATIKTLLGRLVKKEAISTEQSGKKFIYHPRISENETVKSATETLFAHICAKKIGAAITDLVKEAALTPEDVTLIQEALAHKETVPEVICNCIPGQCDCHHTHQSKEEQQA